MKFRKMKIEDFCKTGSGGTPSRKNEAYYGGNIPWVKSGDLRENTIIETEEYISELALKESSAKLVPKGAILFAMYGATVGRMARLGIDAATNQAVCHIIPSPDIANSQYLYYALLNKIPEFMRKAVGGAQPNINQGIIKETEIYLPPLPTQTKIAQILDQSSDLIAKRKAQILELDNLTQSVFLEMFGDPMTNPRKWKIGKIHDVIIKSQYGTSNKASENTGKYPILRMNNITYKGEMDFSNLKYIDLEAKEEDKYLVYKGELLFNRTNSKELVGKTALYNKDYPMAFAGYLIKIIPNKNIVNGEFLSCYMNSQYIKTILLNMAKNIIGMANINAKEMGNIGIYIPDLNIQTQFAQIVEKIQSQKSLLQQSLAELEIQHQALMQKAFNGELVN